MLRGPFQHQRKRAPGQTAFDHFESAEASHAISGDQNGTGLAAEPPPARRVSRCFCWGSGRFSSPVFFRSPHFMGASCARPCIYLYHQAATPVAAARLAICVLRSTHSSGCSWARLPRARPRYARGRSRWICSWARNGTSGCAPIFTIEGRSSLISASRWPGASSLRDLRHGHHVLNPPIHC
jgi:hypothetical protein